MSLSASATSLSATAARSSRLPRPGKSCVTMNMYMFVSRGLMELKGHCQIWASAIGAPKDRSCAGRCFSTSTCARSAINSRFFSSASISSSASETGGPVGWASAWTMPGCCWSCSDDAPARSCAGDAVTPRPINSRTTVTLVRMLLCLSGQILAAGIAAHRSQQKRRTRGGIDGHYSSRTCADARPHCPPYRRTGTRRLSVARRGRRRGERAWERARSGWVRQSASRRSGRELGQQPEERRLLPELRSELRRQTSDSIRWTCGVQMRRSSCQPALG